MTPQSCNFNLNNSSRLLGGASLKAGSSRKAEGGLPTCGRPPANDPVTLPVTLAPPPTVVPVTLPVTLLVDVTERVTLDSTCAAANASGDPLGMERD